MRHPATLVWRMGALATQSVLLDSIALVSLALLVLSLYQLDGRARDFASFQGPSLHNRLQEAGLPAAVTLERAEG